MHRNLSTVNDGRFLATLLWYHSPQGGSRMLLSLLYWGGGGGFLAPGVLCKRRGYN